jgi:hypothetical protein
MGACKRANAAHAGTVAFMRACNHVPERADATRSMCVGVARSISDTVGESEYVTARRCKRRRSASLASAGSLMLLLSYMRTAVLTTSQEAGRSAACGGVQIYEVPPASP